MPLPLVQGGCCARTNAGDPTCFGYNFGTYDLPVNRGRCDKEFHVCVCVRSRSVARTIPFHSALQRRMLVLDGGPPIKKPHVEKSEREEGCNNSNFVCDTSSAEM